ncbi:MAG: sigma-54-dependent transcriptional regulator [Planctomycetota bacterium]
MKILIVDDDRAILRTLALHLEGKHEARTALTLAEGRAALREGPNDLILLDLKLPDGTGLDLLRELREAGDLTPVLLITGCGELEAAIDAMKEGAADYIRKPIDLDALEAAIARIEQAASGAGAGDLVVEEGPPGRRKIAGSSRAALDVLKRIGLAAQSPVTVLILGESGTGKELIARTIHAHSSPAEPFVAVNCSAIVPTLLESELFGHERGSFTGAHETRPGKFELAGSGSVFLDEIGDLSLDLQAKILRVLQEREFERVGGARAIPFRARVIAATNRDLESMVRTKAFREDLYFRLAVHSIRVPPLRERPEDIPELAGHILRRLNAELGKRIRRVSAADLEKLRGHPWPGNVRELENVLTAAALATTGETLDLSVWKGLAGPPASGMSGGASVLGEEGGTPRTLAEAEREQILRALRATGWNITRASALLGISRPTLRKKIADHGIEDPRKA